MTGEHESDKRCALCGGRLTTGVATIPYVLRDTVIVVKNVPAEICGNCHETFTTGVVTDTVLKVLERARQLNAEVSVIAYGEPIPHGAMPIAAG